MSSKTKTEIKAFFETNDKPTEAQFIDLIDSYVDRSGPIGTLEAAASAGNQGFAFVSGGGTEVLNGANALTFMGATVVTTAAVSAVITGLAITTAAVSAFVNGDGLATTAQANAGTATGVLMNPVLVKNAITSQVGTGNTTILLTGQSVGTGTTYTIDSSVITSTFKVLELICVQLSHNSGMSRQFQVEISGNNGSTWSTALQMTNGAAASATRTFIVKIHNAAATSGTRDVGGGDPGANSIGGSVSVTTGAINAIRISPSGDNFDGGTVSLVGYN